MQRIHSLQQSHLE